MERVPGDLELGVLERLVELALHLAGVRAGDPEERRVADDRAERPCQHDVPELELALGRHRRGSAQGRLAREDRDDRVEPHEEEGQEVGDLCRNVLEQRGNVHLEQLNESDHDEKAGESAHEQEDEVSSPERLALLGDGHGRVRAVRVRRGTRFRSRSVSRQDAPFSLSTISHAPATATLRSAFHLGEADGGPSSRQRAVRPPSHGFRARPRRAARSAHARDARRP